MTERLKSATMQDVARLAGVSMMTVSRVISGEAKVKEKTRARVLEAIDHLNYHPNLSARSLASARSHLIALCYQNPSEGYIGQLLIGALGKSQARGYNLVVSSLDESTVAAEEVLNRLISRSKIDGVILPPPLSDSQEILDILAERDIPVVRISPERDHHPFAYVCMDEAEAAFEMTEHLIRQGHRRIGFVKGHPDHGGSRLRYQGFREALDKHGITIPDAYIQQGLFDYKSGFQAAERLVTLREPPTAIFASNDDMAAAAISAAQKHHLPVPARLSVAGFDDSPIATAIWPALTTIRQPVREMAEQATDLLIDKLSPNTGPAREPKQLKHTLAYQVMLRDSVCPPAEDGGG